MATFYDSEKQTAEQTEIQLKDQVTRFGINPWCGICGSQDLRYESQPTRFLTIEEALEEGRKLEAEQAIARRNLGRF